MLVHVKSGKVIFFNHRSYGYTTYYFKAKVQMQRELTVIKKESAFFSKRNNVKRPIKCALEHFMVV